MSQLIYGAVMGYFAYQLHGEPTLSNLAMLGISAYLFFSYRRSA